MAGENRDYTDWLHKRKCQAPRPHACGAPLVVHHPTHLRHTGVLDNRAHDDFGVTLCDFAHGALHSLAGNGPFRGYRRPDIRAFCDEAVLANRAAWEGVAPPGVALSALAYEVPL